MLIACVDDEDRSLDLLQDLMTQAVPGAEVVGFHAAADLLGWMAGETRQPDAVFSDISMPGMDGIELTGALKRLFPTIPVVLVTGHS